MLKSIVQQPYNRIRPYLPRAWGTFAGVDVPGYRLGDVTRSHESYKLGLREALREHTPGERVDLVGFGRGVTTVVMLRAGAEHVTGYEAADEMIRVGERTLRANDVPRDRVTIRHALVGEAVDVYGSADGAEAVPPAALRGSPSDVLVLDCEGAEQSIVPAVAGAYGTIICECHPEKGVALDDVRPALSEYDVDSLPYEPGREEKRILVATD